MIRLSKMCIRDRIYTVCDGRGVEVKGYKERREAPKKGDTLVTTLDNIKPVDVATNVFGQNYNCTMIEMVSAFSSLGNGGNYYQPHVVKKIADDNGNTCLLYTSRCV